MGSKLQIGRSPRRPPHANTPLPAAPRSTPHASTLLSQRCPAARSSHSGAPQHAPLTAVPRSTPHASTLLSQRRPAAPQTQARSSPSGAPQHPRRKHAPLPDPQSRTPHSAPTNEHAPPRSAPRMKMSQTAPGTEHATSFPQFDVTHVTPSPEPGAVWDKTPRSTTKHVDPDAPQVHAPQAHSRTHNQARRTPPSQAWGYYPRRPTSTASKNQPMHRQGRADRFCVRRALAFLQWLHTHLLATTDLILTPGSDFSFSARNADGSCPPSCRRVPRATSPS